MAATIVIELGYSVEIKINYFFAISVINFDLINRVCFSNQERNFNLSFLSPSYL